VVAVVGAVGGVQVEEQVRVDAREQFEQGARLGRFGLDEIAVEVEALRVRSHADARRPVLPGAVLGADVLVAVDVVDRQHP
jgi:hypothetical protein